MDVSVASVAPSLTLPRIAGEGTEQVKWKGRLVRVSPSSLFLARHPSPVTRHLLRISDIVTSSLRHYPLTFITPSLSLNQ
jgi:hypothetical protein